MVQFRLNLVPNLVAKNLMAKFKINSMAKIWLKFG